MSRRHTATSPEQRGMSRDGRKRINDRLNHSVQLEMVEVLFVWMSSGGRVVLGPLDRKTQRREAFSTRRRNDGRYVGELPRNIRLWRERMVAA